MSGVYDRPASASTKDVNLLLGQGRRDIGRQLPARFIVQRACRPLNAEPRALSCLRESGNNMEVDVHHGLMRAGTVILQDVERRSPGGFEDGPAQAGEHSAEGRRGFVRKLVYCFCRLFWDEQGMAAAQRTNIKKCEDLVVFIDFVTRDLTSNDFQKDCLCHTPRVAYDRTGG